MEEYVTHPLAPIWDENSRVLVLGTMPSPRSRAAGFYYAHPRNRFWPMLASLLGEPVPGTVEEKKALLVKRDIALWDVLDSCEIKGASDASIRNPVVHQIAPLLEGSDIRAVFFNGAKAAELFKRYNPPLTLPSFKMPSTSPANAAWNMERLKGSWKIILDFLEG